MVLLLLACSQQVEPPPDAAHAGHEHAEGERHGHALQDRASRVFGSAEAPQDALARFVEGDDKALTADQIAGMELFLSQGCGHCHAGPRLEALDGSGAPSLRGLAGRAGLAEQLAQHGELSLEQAASIAAFLEVLEI